MQNRLKICAPLICSCLILTACSNSDVQTVNPKIGTITSTVNEVAKTRLEHTYALNMPISGKLERITVKPGDSIKKGQLVAKLEQDPININIEEKEAWIKGAIQLQNADTKQELSLKSQADYTGRLLKRQEHLSKKEFVSESALDKFQNDKTLAAIALERQKYIIDATKSGVDISNANLKKATYNSQISKIYSPIDGIILNRKTEGGTWLPAGTNLLSIGSLNELEASAEVLTQQALKLHVGNKVLLSADGIHYNFKGQIKEIYPAGFTKRSALGVDEQRVKIIVSFDNTEKVPFGMGYRLYAKFISAEKKDAIIVPRYSVLQDKEGNYFVYEKSFTGTKKQIVKIGIVNDEEMEITSGLTSSSEIVKEP